MIVEVNIYVIACIKYYLLHRYVLLITKQINFFILMILELTDFSINGVLTRHQKNTCEIENL